MTDFMLTVLQKIVPQKEEREHFLKVSTDFLYKLNSKLKDAKAILGGSGAKDTWLSGSHDVDLFVRFDYKIHKPFNDRLSDLLYAALKKAFPKHQIEKLHGSRDYFQINYEKIDFEIIPILKVSKPEWALNITDLSPLHSVWINAHTKKLKNDIRLAKRFCKANGVYGAESYIGGFSGYVLEVLVAYYGSFDKLLQAATKWKVKEVVDPENYYPKKDALFHLNSSKQQSPLILIDPTDKNRNAAAALSMATSEKFKTLAKEYLQKPAAAFFDKEEISFDILHAEALRRKLHLVYVEATPKTGKVDVVGAQLLKAFDFMSKELSCFRIKKSGWEWDKQHAASMYWLVELNQLPEYEVRAGPPLKFKEYVAAFRKKNKDAFEKDGRLYARIKVEHPKLDDFVRNMIEEEYVKEKVKKIKVL